MPDQVSNPEEMIGQELLRIHEDSYGTGAGRVDVYVLDDRYALAVLENDVTTIEQTLLDAGKGETVQHMRMTFQEAVGASFTAVVERAVGRRVDAFVSHLHVDPMLTIEFFRLAPPAPPLDEPEDG